MDLALAVYNAIEERNIDVVAETLKKLVGSAPFGNFPQKVQMSEEYREEVPLLVHAAGDFPQSVPLFVQAGFDVNIKTDAAIGIGASALYCLGHINEYRPDDAPAIIEAVRALLIAGADPNIRQGDYDGDAPLHIVANTSHNCIPIAGEVATLLVEYGADPNLPAGRYEHRPLDLALRACSAPLVQVLVPAGAVLSDTDAEAPENTDVTRACLEMFNGNTKVIRSLSDTTVNAFNRNGHALLHVATESGDLPAIKLLIERGANIEAQTLHRFTPLQFASWNGYSSIVETLLNAGADIHKADENIRPPLYAAIDGAMGNNRSEVEAEDTIRLLISREANVDGIKPLLYAARRGSLRVVKILLELGFAKTKQDWDDLIESAKPTRPTRPSIQEEVIALANRQIR